MAAKKYIVSWSFEGENIAKFTTSSLDEAKAMSNELDQQGKQNAISSFTVRGVSSYQKPKPKPAFNDLALFGELSPFAF
tara:strand:+ start:65 stop:301 length:237 start_codon:yes stop_codon:yes gene_type:complete